MEPNRVAALAEYEPFVDASRAAAFLAVEPRFLLSLARKGAIPAHPLGTGSRKVWRFRLSEISRAVASQTSDNARGGSSALRNGESQ